jgi:4-hydroxy-2-oxoglutarate aldolase
MLLEGLFLPLTTPFYPDGRLNLRKLEHNAGRYSKTPAAGLVALGESGEPSLLSDDETRLVLRSVVEASAAEKVLVAGVSRDSVAGTLDLAEYAAGLGYDAVLVGPSAVVRGEREMISYFQMVADRSALPVVLYGRASQLPVELVVELAAHPRVIGLVDGAESHERIEMIRSGTLGVKREVTVTAVFAAMTGRMLARQEGSAGGALISLGTLTDGGAAVAVAPAKPAVKTRTKVVGFQILAGETAGMLGGLMAGAVGAMSPFAACAPQACYEVLAAWKDGDRGLAEEKQARLLTVAKKVEDELGAVGLKYGCDLNGYYGGVARLPQLPLAGAEREEIEGLMQGLRN